jgi:geranylgeranyl pyrophosphate synthase
MLYMEQCQGQGEGADLLRRVLNGREAPEEDHHAAVNLIRASGVLNAAYAEAERYSAQAKQHLARIPASESRNLLLRLAEAGLQRAY